MENIIQIHCSHGRICDVNDVLHDEVLRRALDDSPAHLYFLIALPRVSATGVVKKFDMQHGQQLWKTTLVVSGRAQPVCVGAPASSVRSISLEGDGRTVCLENNDGSITRECADILYAQRYPRVPVKVLYVGRAFGDGSRTAKDRLQAHGKYLQLIAHYQRHSASETVWAVPVLVTRQPTRINVANWKSNDHESTAGTVNDFLTVPLSESLVVNVAEAALIRYFHTTTGNETFTESFPSQDHVSYADIYDKGVDTIQLTLANRDLPFLLSSELIPPKDVHSAEYRINETKDDLLLLRRDIGSGLAEMILNAVLRK